MGKIKMEKYKKTQDYKDFQAAKKAKKFAKKPKDKNAPKRPLSAYMLFSADNRKGVTAEVGSASKVTLIAKRLARDGQRRVKTKRQSTVHRLQTSKQTMQKSVLSTRRAESTQTTKRSSPPGKSQKRAQENRQRLFTAAAKSCAHMHAVLLGWTLELYFKSCI